MSVQREPWVRIQMKTFTRWCNSFLRQRDLEIGDIEKDLSDGHLLYNLLECLGQETIYPKVKPGAKIAFQKLENINTSLQYIKSKQVKLVGIGPEGTSVRAPPLTGTDIERGNLKLILGLIWTLILRFQIVDVDPNKTVRQALLEWCNSVLEPQGLHVDNFTSNWQNGLCFCGLVNALQPGHIDLKSCNPDEQATNLNRSFKDAEELFKFPQVLDAEDVIEHPDELSIMTYVSYFRAYLLQNTAYAPNCTAEGPGLHKAVTFEPATFVVTCRSEENEQATRGGANVRCQLLDASGAIVCPVTVKDNGNGTYNCSYEATVDGDLTLKVMIGTADIKDSPFRPHVEPGEPNPGSCEAFGDGLHTAKAGEEAHFTVQTKDKNGKNLPRGGAIVESTFQDPSGAIPVRVVDNGNGTYSCSYVPKVTGKSQLNVVVKTKAFGEGPVKDSPFTVSVHPGEMDLSSFEWSGVDLDSNGNRIVVAGNTDRFTVHAKDALGNRQTSGGCPVHGKMEGVDHVDVNVNDKQDGSYELSYTPYKIGKYTVAVDVNGTPIGGAKNPFPVLVVAAPPSGANSIASGPGISKAQVGGANNKFKIETRDAFNNPVTLGGASVEGFLEKEGEAPIPVTVTDNNDGTYDCSYPGIKKAGNYKLTPTVNGEKVKDAPFTVTVAPGGFSADNTFVQFPDEWVATMPGPIVSVCDTEGNLRAGAGDKVEARLVSLDDIEVKAKHQPDGGFSVAFPPDCRGDYNVQVKVNGQDAPGGPWQVRVDEKPLSQEHEQAVAQLMPTSRDVFRRLLLECTESERDKIVRELGKLAGSKFSSSASSSSSSSD